MGGAASGWSLDQLPRQSDQRCRARIRSTDRHPIALPAMGESVQSLLVIFQDPHQLQETSLDGVCLPYRRHLAQEVGIAVQRIPYVLVVRSSLSRRWLVSKIQAMGFTNTVAMTQIGKRKLSKWLGSTRGRVLLVGGKQEKVRLMSPDNRWARAGSGGCIRPLAASVCPVCS